jgi:hypothetical protein
MRLIKDLIQRLSKSLSKTAWLVLGIGVLVIALGSLYMLYLRQTNEQEQLNDSLSDVQADLPGLVAEQGDLESQLTLLENQLAQWESQLAQAVSLFNSTVANFPESVESIEYDEEFFEIAYGWDLKITGITASSPRDEKVKVEIVGEDEYGEEIIEETEVVYSVTSFQVDVEGEVAGILGFIDTMVTSEDFICATAELINISVPEPLEDSEKAAITERYTGGILTELEDEDLTEAEREELLEALEEAFAAAEEEIEETEMPSASIRLIIYSYEGE